MFEIELFRCNVNETSITLSIFIFLFYQEILQKWKYTVEMRTYQPGLNPLTLYASVRFRYDSPLPLSAYVLYGWPLSERKPRLKEDIHIQKITSPHIFIKFSVAT